MNFIYLITDGTDYKIGKTNNLSYRLSNLNTGNSEELKIVYSIECSDVNRAEKEIHHIFRQEKIYNKEWFHIRDSNYAIRVINDVVDNIEERERLKQEMIREINNIQGEIL